MCGCISRAEKAVKEHYKVERAEFLCQSLVPGNRLFSEVAVYAPDKKKAQLIDIQYNFCPICGEKYPDIKEAK